VFAGCWLVVGSVEGTFKRNETWGLGTNARSALSTPKHALAALTDRDNQSQDPAPPHAPSQSPQPPNHAPAPCATGASATMNDSYRLISYPRAALSTVYRGCSSPWGAWVMSSACLMSWATASMERKLLLRTESQVSTWLVIRPVVVSICVCLAGGWMVGVGWWGVERWGWGASAWNVGAGINIATAAALNQSFCCLLLDTRSDWPRRTLYLEVPVNAAVGCHGSGHTLTIIVHLALI